MALNWLKYWRNTLVDAARVKIEVTKTIHRTNCIINFNDGTVNGNTPQQLIDQEERRHNQSKNITNRNSPNWQIINEVPVLISPFYLSPQQNNYNNQKSIIYPFWIKAILNRAGSLSVDEDTFPYIPRDYLAPLVNQNINYTFSSVETVDEIVSLFNGNNWNLYWSFITKCFFELTQIEINNYQVKYYKVVHQNTIVVNNNISGVSVHIIKLYNFLIKNNSTPPLLNTITNENELQLSDPIKVKEFPENSVQHLGQMGNKFALSFSQRQSLYHYLKQSDDEVLAINGPPGTGKTTLLQSVVANEVVQSAIDGNEPRLILVASNNNQAVTNIIDSFASIENQNNLLTKRWLPDVNSFVMYLPGSTRQVNNDIHYFRFGDQGSFPDQVQNQQYLLNAKQLYIQNFNEVSKTNLNSVQKIVDTLRDRIIHNRDNLEEGIKLWKKYKTLYELFFQLGVEPDNFLIGSNLDLEKLSLYENQLKRLESNFSDYLEKESFWIRLFSCLKFVKDKRATKFKQIFRNCPISYKSINFYSIPSIHNFFDDRFSTFNEIKTVNDNWIKWKKIYHLKGNPPLSDSELKNCENNNIPYFYDEFETTLKYKLFYLAVHYWEGRWIIETERAIVQGALNNNGRNNAIQKWQRFAMLTPCFVSTFYMVPKFLTYSVFIGNDNNGQQIWETLPLLSSLDLLIVDEAGQVAPEVSVATFALAKKALVVGDISQIEPVWNVPYQVDHANLEKFNLINNINDSERIEKIGGKGFLSSSGNIMKLAQKSSKYKFPNNTERGMFLKEHRRCYNEIIEYCNQLAYNGLLEPKRGNPTNPLYRPMQFIHVQGDSQIENSSRKNINEARAIVNWIIDNKEKIKSYYQQLENTQAEKDNRNPKDVMLSNI
ncbi:MAG: AAA domain-containing protein, partial [Melioribacteraceae bacterium]